jgi:hypothetical protein
MITPQLLPTARPGKPGLTFFVYQDILARSLVMSKIQSYEAGASIRFRQAMAREIRTLERGSVRRQYIVHLVDTGQGLRALHDHEIDAVKPTHYRLIWFAEAVGI